MANYIKITWTNTCDIGRVLYNGTGFTNALFLDTDIIKPLYETEETGYENGNGVFIKTSEKLKKICGFEFYGPEYVADAMKFMAMHDTIQLMFVNRDYSSSIRNVEVDVSWDDSMNGCMALIQVRFEQDDQVVKTSCCDNMS
jgi:hypothetical protein